MGFGLLFLGYFVATFMTLHAFGSLVRVIGFGLVLMAALRLRQYHRAFDWMGLGTVLMLLFSLSLAVFDTADWLGFGFFPENGKVILGYVEQGISLIFQVLMLSAIRAIAKETGVDKIASNAIRNFVFVCLYYLVYLVRFLPVASIQATAGELAWIAWMLYLAWQILDLLLIGSCYMRICDESDEEMERKPSRFAFVNKLRAENERRTEKARREYAEYQKEKQSKRRKK